MRRKAVIDRLYLFFWFFPIVLLPFTWVNAVVQGAEILGLIQGSGFVVSRNFPALTVFYLVISVGLLLPKSLINHYNWQLLYFSCLLIFTSMFSLLPRMIIGPNGLSESGLKDSAYPSMYFLTIKPCFYLVIVSFILATFFYFWSEIRIKSERSVSIKNNR
ncbi:hypothetical protein [Enterococcus faecium]|uniref:Uncharacterized protein n=1 Tax=Enterococcus faecium TaxID=1352 RepID=A0A7V7KTR0_ENTFC|nr:hypothetical protein [Enterococcus faecium]EME8111192.1 hypothetical protein [Enterococcus faecium]KAA0690284.1 hypothetical protein DTX73_08155 [Enterococcus faecium]MBK5027732.1 hypothetical protein [Enterococcus faecium]MBK5038231.1 hypothetical protein [Enterococcus faecium]MBK5043231.1 hypothetical protein [Enterococcus faecium]